MKKIVYKTSSIRGEGKAEENFFRYLKQLYTKRQSGHSITIQETHCSGNNGGSSRDVVYNAMSLCNNRDFNAFLFVLDGDILNGDTCYKLYELSKKKHCRQLRKKIPLQYRCIFIFPCFENLLLKILDTEGCTQTIQCKEKFRRVTNGKEAHKLTKEDYTTFFSREILNSHRNIPELKNLIDYFSLTGDKFNEWFNH